MENSTSSVREYSVQKTDNVVIALLLGITIVCGVIVVSLLFSLNALQQALVVLIAIILFIIIMFSLLGTSKVKVIKQKIEKPVVQIVEKPVVNTVYVEKERKKLDIPHYEYIGSMQTRTYHLRTCRLGKLVKKKYQLSNNSLEFFKKRKFRPCKICILKQRKV